MKIVYAIILFTLIGYLSYVKYSENEALDNAYKAGYDAAESEYQTKQLKIMADAKATRERIYAESRATIDQQTTKARQREDLLASRINQLRRTVNELRQANACNITYATVRLLNDQTLRYRGQTEGGQFADDEAGSLTIVTGADFDEWTVNVVKQYYDVAEQLIALQEEVRQRGL